jgi:hypothetical protein
MYIVKNITKHEMNRRFVIGEVYSEFFPSRDELYKQETLNFLNSGDVDLEHIGIQRHWKRGNFLNFLPNDTAWSLSQLRLSEDEFARLRTVNDGDWIKYTNRSLRLIDAAIFLQANPGSDQRVAEVISAFNRGQCEMCGITLFSDSLEGPFTIVEGTARLVALYLNCIQKKSTILCTEEIEVVFGLSHSKWRFSS